MADFHVKKPSYTSWDWFKFIAMRVIFPPVLLWDLLQFIVNQCLGKWVGSFVLEAQHQYVHEQEFKTLSIPEQNVFKGKGLTCHFHHVITHDGIRLDTIEYNPKSLKNIPKNQQK